MTEIRMISTEVCFCKDWSKFWLVWGLSQPEKLMYFNKYPLTDYIIHTLP